MFQLIAVSIFFFSFFYTKDKNNKIALIILSPIIFPLIHFFGYALTSIGGDKYYVMVREEIVSLTNDKNINGSFILGVNSYNEYNAFVIIDNGSKKGGYVKRTFPNSSVIFMHPNITDPHVNTWMEYRKAPWWVSFVYGYDQRTHYDLVDIFVPTNTIVEKFEVR